jgi:rhodanese-related sulfurtransferase
MESEKLGSDELAPDDAREVIATERGQTVDVRDGEEFAAGHIPGAVNVPEDELEKRLDELSKDGPVIVVCASGSQSARAAEQLRERGYEAASMKGGMKAWQGDSLPLQPAEDEEFHGPRRPGPLGA